MLILDENFRRHLEAFASELFKYTFNLHSDEYCVFIHLITLYSVCSISYFKNNYIVIYIATVK